MPRKTRMHLPGIPAHIVQRGNNRAACFFADKDYRFYLACLERGLRRYGVELHAYVLMTNHVHLLLTPQDESGISRLTQHLGRHYVLYINKNYQRNGTLWEGRHKASLIQDDYYLLLCMRYIELNPVTAGMVKSPEQYCWSSYRHNAWDELDTLITQQTLYRQLGTSPAERHAAYRELFRYQIPDAEVHELQQCLASNYPLGNDRFREQIEVSLGRRLGARGRGRPAKNPSGQN